MHAYESVNTRPAAARIFNELRGDLLKLHRLCRADWALQDLWRAQLEELS